MITFNTTDDKSGNDLDVTLFSNKWEFELSVGNDWPESLNLNKDQVSNLIVALVEMHKEML